jgi:hypothetical protein
MAAAPARKVRRGTDHHPGTPRMIRDLSLLAEGLESSGAVAA